MNFKIRERRDQEKEPKITERIVLSKELDFYISKIL